MTTKSLTAPVDFPGTLPEWLVFRELTRLGEEFEYQSSKLGGRQERGGVVVDFWIADRNLALNVASQYWHYGRPEGILNDKLQREALLAMGLEIIYLDEEALLRNARYYVEAALRGEDYSRMARGLQ